MLLKRRTSWSELPRAIGRRGEGGGSTRRGCFGIKSEVRRAGSSKLLHTKIPRQANIYTTEDFCEQNETSTRLLLPPHQQYILVNSSTSFHPISPTQIYPLPPGKFIPTILPIHHLSIHSNKVQANFKPPPFFRKISFLEKYPRCSKNTYSPKDRKLPPPMPHIYFHFGPLR